MQSLRLNIQRRENEKLLQPHNVSGGNVEVIVEIPVRKNMLPIARNYHYMQVTGKRRTKAAKLVPCRAYVGL